jgi:Fur family transcriptional regulator, ferric uptake regulator
MGAAMHHGEWSQSTLEALQRKGLRNGGARRAVIDLLAEQDCCLTAQEMFDRLRESDRKVGIASVYRVLELLTSEGLVQRIDLGSGIARYEPVHSGGDHHHHLVCDSCGRVEAFEDPSLERALVDLESASGYLVAGHDVVLHGACADCR